MVSMWAWSITPYIYMSPAFIEFVGFKSRWGTRQVCFLYFVGFLVVCNEFIIKRFCEQARPGASGQLTDDMGNKVGSCNLTCGMPSSHASMAFGFFTLLVYDGISRVVPSPRQLGAENLNLEPYFGVLSPNPIITHHQLALCIVLWGVLLLPVPIARVILYDHSATQVLVGGALGGVYATIWFGLVMKIILPRLQRDKSHFLWGGLVNNYMLPTFQVREFSAGGWMVLPNEDLEQRCLTG